MCPQKPLGMCILESAKWLAESVSLCYLLKALAAILPAIPYPQFMQHTSAFWKGKERSGSLAESAQLRKPGAHSDNLTLPQGRNHGLRRSLLELSCVTLRAECCLQSESAPLTFCNASNLRFFFFSNGVIGRLHWTPGLSQRHSRPSVTVNISVHWGEGCTKL